MAHIDQKRLSEREPGFSVGKLYRHNRIEFPRESVGSQQLSHSLSREARSKGTCNVRFPYTNAFQLSSFGDSDVVIKNF